MFSMRILSTILVLCLSYTLAHESLHHHGEASDSSSALRYTEPHEHHEEQGQHSHEHPTPLDDRDNENHDGDTHDHQFTALVLKKTSSTHKQAILQQANSTPLLLADMPCSAVASIISHAVSFREEASLPAYVRAHVLRL